jgi:hypothetical protein
MHKGIIADIWGTGREKIEKYEKKIIEKGEVNYLKGKVN